MEQTDTRADYKYQPLDPGTLGYQAICFGLAEVKLLQSGEAVFSNF